MRCVSLDELMDSTGDAIEHMMIHETREETSDEAELSAAFCGALLDWCEYDSAHAWTFLLRIARIYRKRPSAARTVVEFLSGQCEGLSNTFSSRATLGTTRQAAHKGFHADLAAIRSVSPDLADGIAAYRKNQSVR